MTVEALERARIVVDRQERVVALNRAARDRLGDVEGEALTDVRSTHWIGNHTVAVARPLDTGDVEVLRVATEPASPTGQGVACSRFLAYVSHELRTPVTAILGFAHLLRSGRAGPLNDQQAHHLERVVQGSEHLLRLVSDILDLARIDAGHLELDPEPVDLCALLEQAVADVRPMADAKSLQITCAAQAESAYLDPVRFKQVLYNYLSNAIKFTPQGGRIGVRLTQAAPDLLRIAVEDTGIGVASDQVHRLFTEFGQVARGLHTCAGSGLGLLITKRIVTAMGGTVGVQSEPGQGSTFWAEIPRRKP